MGGLDLPRGSFTQGVPDAPSDTGMAYNYNLGGRRGRNALAAMREARQAQTERDKETRQAEQDRIREAHENLRDSLALQAERLRAATALETHSREMQKMQEQEKILTDSAQFRRFYGMLKDNDPNRKAQLAELYNMFPGAIKSPELQSAIAADNKRLGDAVKQGLSKEESDFLKTHGPSSYGGKDNNYKALQAAAGNTGAAGHEEAAIAYGRVHDLMKKSVGLPTGTPEGISREDYIKSIESSFQKPVGQPNPAAQPPSPSTPAPQNVAGWSNTDLSGQIAPINRPASGAPAVPAPATAAPAGNPKAFLDEARAHFQKTSDAGAAAAATNRGELNDMLNSSPETQFAAPNPPPTPTPTPAPKEQYYTA